MRKIKLRTPNFNFFVFPTKTEIIFKEYCYFITNYSFKAFKMIIGEFFSPLHRSRHMHPGHAGGFGCFDADRAILEDHAVFGRDGHEFCGK